MWNILLPVVVGGVLAIGGGVATQWLQYRRERKNLAAAFAGEIGAILAIVRRREYREGIVQIIQTMETTDQQYHFEVGINQSFWRVYDANAGKLGMLPGAAVGEVAQFYTYMLALVEDVTQPRDWETAQDAIAAFKESLQVLDEMLELGDSVVSRLNGKREVPNG